MKTKLQNTRPTKWNAGLSAALITVLALPASAAVTLPSTPPGSGNTIPPNILFILDDSGSMVFEAMPADTISDWKGRTYVHNSVYYNPATTYQPWMGADSTRLTGGTSYSSVYADLSRAEGDTIDLSDSRCKEVDRNGSEHNVCGGIQTYYVPKDLTRTDAAYLDARSNYYRFQILANGRVERTVYSGGSWINPIFITPTGREEVAERQNYATWFSYHRSRMKAAKAGASEAFAALDGEKYRVGFTTIWGPGSGYKNAELLIPVQSDNGLFREFNRKAWFDRLFAARGKNGTPLLPALQRAGRYFSETGDSGPYGGIKDASGKQFQCRQNFSILTTDGFWNSGSANVGDADNTAGVEISAPANPDGSPGRKYTYQPVAPYKGAASTTLADVAMHYWKTDLRSDLLNIVPTSTLNPAFWQHMVTFGISIGLSGTVDQTSVAEVLEKGGVSVNGVDLGDWPDPTNKEDRERIDDLLHAAVNGHGEFVAATDPTAFAKALEKALATIGERVGSRSNVSASSTSISTETKLFQAKYLSESWSGDIIAYPVTATGVNEASPVWKASEKFPAWESRKIFTTDAAGTRGAFPTANQSAVLGGSPGGFSIADYIRGNRLGEESKGGDLRNRAHPLGDIIHSSPFYSKDTDRIFVGSNNGMMHAFDAGSGVEAFAYIPRGIQMAQLKELSGRSYSHRYFVDGPITVSDRAMTRTTAHPNGRNILAGTLGHGGKGVFALDVTTPEAFNAGSIKFDISGDADMGLVMGEPIVAKLNDGSVSVIFGNGLNSSNDRAVLWVVNVDTGNVTKLQTNSSTSNGLSGPRGWDSDGDGILDLVYAGDQQGNLWKFNLEDKSASKWGVDGGNNVNNSNSKNYDPLFVATDAAGNRQPISGAVSLGIDPVNYMRWVFFGTGRLLTNQDLASTSVQSMYGIVDGDAIGTRADNDAANGLLVQRKIAESGSIAGKAVRAFESSSVMMPAGKRGWFVDLLTPPNGLREGERIIGDAQVVGGVFITSSIIPSSDPCTPGGRGYINAINAFTGGSVGEHFFDVDGDGVYSDDELNGKPVGSIDLGVGMNTDSILIDKLLSAGGSSGGTGSVGINPSSASGRVSWREVLRK
ncbi:pilus assembly protein [Novilysobacter antarcticus]|uniref:pilus assembly protein n=1 Tax=Novilysobacter antarcticus TaxID=2862543 RepID=UPI001C992C72|nr:PilC/PilY family type IV pilus protein [Lysobacter antarcticus]